MSNRLRRQPRRGKFHPQPKGFARRRGDGVGQPALPAQAQRRMAAHHHRPPLRPAQRPDPRDKKSRSTINSPILACRSRTSLS